MADFAKPDNNSLKTVVLSEQEQRATDIATMAKPSANIPTNYIHWNSGSDTFEIYNGATWDPLSTSFAMALNGTSVLTALAGVDGAGSGLDADLLDGQQGSYYLAASTYTASDVLTKIMTVDGAGSGLDADLLDGVQGANYARTDGVSNVFGSVSGTPVQIKDTNSTGTAATPYIPFYDQTATRLGYIGLGSSGNDNVYIASDAGSVQIIDSVTGNGTAHHSGADNTTTGFSEAAGGFVSQGAGESLRIANPGGASMLSTGSQTGAIKISMPVLWSTTMLSFTVRIYEYGANESCEFHISGYTHAGSSQWLNVAATQIGAAENHSVRFGSDGSKSCVYIGDIGQLWGYPQICVNDAVLGFQGATLANWSSGWDVTMENSAFQNVTQTLSKPKLADLEPVSGKQEFWGNQTFFGTDTSGVYSGAPVELREVNKVGNSQTSAEYAPALSFHWGVITQKKLYMSSAGHLMISAAATGGDRLHDSSWMPGTLHFQAELAGGRNLNNYVTTGYWHQAANSEAISGSNYPVGKAGLLEVYGGETGMYIYQRYTTYDGVDEYYRVNYNSVWSSWKQAMHHVNVNGILASIGVGGIGSHAMLEWSSNSKTILAGTNYAGSSLRYSGVNSGGSSNQYAYTSGAGGSTPAGTWMAMGTISARSDRRPVTLFKRTS